MNVNTPHYEKKIADLQRRLDSQYDAIDEVEQDIAEVRAQILDLKKSSISADSVYEFLLLFDEIYRECTDAEKKKFTQSFVECIELYPKLARIDGISMETSIQNGVDLPLEKFPTHEAIVLLGQKSRRT